MHLDGSNSVHRLDENGANWCDIGAPGLVMMFPFFMVVRTNWSGMVRYAPVAWPGSWTWSWCSFFYGRTFANASSWTYFLCATVAFGILRSVPVCSAMPWNSCGIFAIWSFLGWNVPPLFTSDRSVCHLERLKFPWLKVACWWSWRKG